MKLRGWFITFIPTSTLYVKYIWLHYEKYKSSLVYLGAIDLKIK
jgi:hypothetical protein